MATPEDIFLEQDMLARKIADLIRREFDSEQLATIGKGQAMWLAFQMICGPEWAALMVQRSSASCFRK